MHRKRPALLLASLLLLGSCGPSTAAENESRIAHYVSGEPARLVLSGVEVTVEPEVELGVVSVSGSSASRFQASIGSVPSVAPRDAFSAWISGRELSVRGGVLAIGERQFGAVDADDEVRIGPDGVTVNEESRGELPR